MLRDFGCSLALLIQVGVDCIICSCRKLGIFYLLGFVQRIIEVAAQPVLPDAIYHESLYHRRDICFFGKSRKHPISNKAGILVNEVIDLLRGQSLDAVLAVSGDLTKPNGERIGAFIVLQIVRLFLHVAGYDIAAVPVLVGPHRIKPFEDVIGQRVVRGKLLNSKRRILGKCAACRFPFQPTPHPIGERRNNGRFTAHRDLDKLIVSDFDEDVAILDVVGKLFVVLVLFQPIVQQAHDDTRHNAV